MADFTVSSTFRLLTTTRISRDLDKKWRGNADTFHPRRSLTVHSLLSSPSCPLMQAAKNTRPSSTLLQRALVRTAMQESSPEGYAQACEMISRTGSPNWDKITSRVLVIAGREDQISSFKAAEEVAGAFALSRVGKAERKLTTGRVVQVVSSRLLV